MVEYASPATYFKTREVGWGRVLSGADEVPIRGIEVVVKESVREVTCHFALQNIKRYRERYETGSLISHEQIAPCYHKEGPRIDR